MRKSVLCLAAFLVLATGVTVAAISGHYLPTYIQADLPKLLSAGRVAVLTDSIGGLWYDTGTAWTPLAPSIGAGWLLTGANRAYLGIGTSTPLSRVHVKGPGGDDARIRIEATGAVNGAFLALIAVGQHGHEWADDTDGTLLLRDFSTQAVQVRVHSGGGLSTGNLSGTGLSVNDIMIPNLNSYRAKDSTDTGRVIAQIDGSNNINIGDTGITAIKFFPGAAVTATLNATGDLVLASGKVDLATGPINTISTGVGSLKMSTGVAATNTTWIPMKWNGVTFWVPAFTTNAP